MLVLDLTWIDLIFSFFQWLCNKAQTSNDCIYILHCFVLKWINRRNIVVASQFSFNSGDVQLFNVILFYFGQTSSRHYYVVVKLYELFRLCSHFFHFSLRMLRHAP